MSNVMADREISNLNQNSLCENSQQWLTVRQFCERFPWPSESGMRAYVYRAAELGISDAFLRVGRRVLIAPTKFFTLIEQLERGARK